MTQGVSIVLAGAAGQGIETVADIMARTLKLSGYGVFVTREFMSRIRGGTNSVQLRVTESPVGAYVRRTDILIPLTGDAIPHIQRYSRMDDDTVVIGEEEILLGANLSDHRSFAVPFTEIALEIGHRIYSNTVAAGLVTALFGVEEEIAVGYLSKRFGSRGVDIVNQNIEAIRAGRKFGAKLLDTGMVSVDVKKTPGARESPLMTGTDAVALGAIAGGCNFISSYPMSPSTGVLVFFSGRAREFGIVVDQAEDEIAAINKALGAWYAGGRGMVTTSGGGFALMVEGLSLSGMHETPVVIHLAQRPGPATGLPTRTGQEDLQFALNAGHGEFPRVILAPGTPLDAFRLTQRAFNLADEYQIPVFVLTDQFLLDSTYTSRAPDLSEAKVEMHIVETRPGYKRYRLTETGISPRGIPGFGEGLVGVDSDEHDEEGHITEDLNLRPRMVEKRLHRKMEALRSESIPPTLIGGDGYETLVLAWGSNYHCVREAIERCNREDVSLLHFSQVYPLHPETSMFLENAGRVAIVENNATCQFGKIIQQETSFRIPDGNRLLKFDGLPFTVEQVEEFMGTLGKEG